MELILAVPVAVLLKTLVGDLERGANPPEESECLLAATVCSGNDEDRIPS